MIEKRIALRSSAWGYIVSLAVRCFDNCMRIEIDQGDKTATRLFVIEDQPTMNYFAAGVVSRPSTGILVAVEFTVPAIHHLIGDDSATLAARVEAPCEHQKFDQDTTSI